MFKRLSVLLLLFVFAIMPGLAEEDLSGLSGEMPAAEDGSPVIFDDRADYVRTAQKGLASLGYYKDTVDGRFGKHTEAAIREFQRQSGLAETGHLDEGTYTLLKESVPEDIDTKSIQQRLIDLGYLQGAADGKFGKKSKSALSIFQRVNGLPVTGSTNSRTIAVLFSDQAITMPSALSSGSTGEEVEMLQRNLIRYGFMTEEIDGEYGKTTMNAVRAFQQHLIEQEIPVDKTGSASPLTLYCLYSEDYSSYLRDVSVGMTDSEVKRMELRLVALGYLDAEADETFDDYTREALCLFQGKAYLETSDTADKKTFDTLFSAAAPAADHCAPHDISSGDTGMAVHDVENALLAAGYTVQMPRGEFDKSLEKTLELIQDCLMEEDSTTHLSRETVASLQNGLFEFPFKPTSSTDAARMQRRLYTLYYMDKTGIDGMIGRDTLSALHEFQDVNGLPQTDGKDPQTISVLFSTDAISKRYPYRIEVSIERQKVEVWSLNDQNEYECVQTFKCSTGLHDTTPRGIFLNGHPANRWHFFKKFNCWAQYSFKIVDDILFHSVIYGSKNENTLRRSSQRNLGNPASHGCVRLSVDDAKWLYEHCKRGTVVIVIQ